MKYYITIFTVFIMHPIFVKAQATSLQKSGIASISVQLEGAKATDTLMLMYFKDNLFNEPTQNGEYQELQSTSSIGHYQFAFPITDQTGYFFLAKKTLGRFRFVPVCNLLKAEAGDNVLLKISNKDTKARNLIPMYRYSCSGFGRQKYNIRFKLDSISYWTKSINIPIFSPMLKYNEENNNRHRINVALDYLDSNKNHLDAYQFQLLKADLFFSNGYPLFLSIMTKFRRLTGDERDIFKVEYLCTIGQINLKNFSSEILARSKSAIGYFLLQAKTTMLITGKEADPKALYNYLCANYNGVVLDQLLVYYFMKLDTSNTEVHKQIEEAQNIIKTPRCLERLRKIKERFLVLGLGKEYGLTDITGKSVSLSDFKGKVVFVDFWFSGCVFCSNYVKEQLAHVEEAFKDNPNVIFLSISIDRIKSTWLSSIDAKKYTLPSSINLYTNGLGKNHFLIKQLGIQGYPTIMILDKTGNVAEFGAPSEETSPQLYQSNSLIGILEDLLIK